MTKKTSAWSGHGQWLKGQSNGGRMSSVDRRTPTDSGARCGQRTANSRFPANRRPARSAINKLFHTAVAGDRHASLLSTTQASNQRSVGDTVCGCAYTHRRHRLPTTRVHIGAFENNDRWTERTANGAGSVVISHYHQYRSVLAPLFFGTPVAFFSPSSASCLPPSSRPFTRRTRLFPTRLSFISFSGTVAVLVARVRFVLSTRQRHRRCCHRRRKTVSLTSPLIRDRQPTTKTCKTAKPRRRRLNRDRTVTATTREKSS